MSQVQLETAVQREVVSVVLTHLQKNIISPDYSYEVIGVIPHLGPDFVAAILKPESNTAVDLQADSKSVTKTSSSAQGSQSRVDERTEDTSHQDSMVRKTWRRVCSFWAQHVVGGQYPI